MDQSVGTKYDNNVIFSDIRLPIAGATYQPLGYDQWTTQYAAWLVRGMKLNCTFINDTDVNMVISVCPRREGIGGADASIATSLMRPYTKYITLGKDTGSNKGRIRHYASTRAVLGLRNLELTDTDYVGVVGDATTPKFPTYWHINAFSADDTTTTFTVNAVIRVTYYVTFFRRNSLAPSAV
jgi:hypothetical protein